MNDEQHDTPDAQAQLDEATARIEELEQQLADAQAAQPEPEPEPEAPTPSPVQPVVADDYTGLTLEAHRDAAGGRWRFGVSMGGAFIVLYERKLGAIDDDLAEAATPGFQAQRAALYEREVLGNR